MNDPPAGDDRSQDELSDQAPGTSVILIGEAYRIFSGRLGGVLKVAIRP